MRPSKYLVIAAFALSLWPGASLAWTYKYVEDAGQMIQYIIALSNNRTFTSESLKAQDKGKSLLVVRCVNNVFDIALLSPPLQIISEKSIVSLQLDDDSPANLAKWRATSDQTGFYFEGADEIRATLQKLKTANYLIIRIEDPGFGETYLKFAVAGLDRKIGILSPKCTLD